MTCPDCSRSCVYDLNCPACCARLVASCRSRCAPAVARAQQEAMLALIARHGGESARADTIRALRNDNPGGSQP